MALMHQETWVRFGTNGIGLSDHQNRYSSGVRVGSWVENEYGDTMQATLQPPAFQGTSTHMADFTVPQGNGVERAMKIGNVSNIDMAHGPEETHDQTLMTSTYDLAMCHADGEPRRVETMLWSGITKVDKEVPTGTHRKQTLLEKKRAQWAEDRDDEWKSAYKAEYRGVPGEEVKKQVQGLHLKQKSLSMAPRLHLSMGLREYI
mmetsp:Transcript_55796/g.136659  ORF Transcript_55796/g.136659 Transcript_55796/m.136659 type:complete len:204 (+) Transcript_55796:114-725(+)|eukprot:CAMPEP_0206226844 /NCGR_PEP_ID=MMETSP0047_2-20121206/8308_1 /ASSEMBLY_ACC=CAM_ASM_000192 /TAXON_ID=195065 /ORGANISM="Chroomonas mesostigmatica_cf, Strain CCMP1168" /LENGTH=203 /DNA_ID=CAMNT_0053649959 /DNA_START=97 /DNA_END=708 /DNA_ORIENTATION=+